MIVNQFICSQTGLSQLIEFFAVFHQVQSYLINPTRDQIATGNLVFVAICVCTGVLLGSVTSIYVVGGMLYGVWHIIHGATNWKFDRAAVASALAFAGFFAAELIAYGVHPGGDGAREVLSNLPFLGLLPIYSLMIVDRDRLKTVIEGAAAYVAIIAAVLAVIIPTTAEARVELGAGNPGIAAVLASILFLINYIAWIRRGRTAWQLPVLSVAASLVVLMLTGVRSQWPNLVVIPLLVMFIYRSNVLPKLTAKSFAVLVIIIVAVGGLIFSTTSQRVAAMASDIIEIRNGDYSSSLGTRAVLWKSGAEMIVQQPFFGYGPGNVVEKIEEATKAQGLGSTVFSHFHNMIINELMRAGVVGLFAMIMMFLVPYYFVFNAPKSADRSWALALITGAHVTYFLSGLTGIMIGHDILDCLLIVLVALSLYLVRDENAEAGA
jgi:O-antigen ligase